MLSNSVEIDYLLVDSCGSRGKYCYPISVFCLQFLVILDKTKLMKNLQCINQGSEKMALYSKTSFLFLLTSSSPFYTKRLFITVASTCIKLLAGTTCLKRIMYKYIYEWRILFKKKLPKNPLVPVLNKE